MSWLQTMKYLHIVLVCMLLGFGEVESQNGCLPVFRCGLACRNGYQRDKRGCYICRCLATTRRDCTSLYCDPGLVCAMMRPPCPRIPPGGNIDINCPRRPTCTVICGGRPNMFISKCISTCQKLKTCSDPNPPPIYCASPCVSSCICKTGYVVDDVDGGGCILLTQCRPTCKGHRCSPNHHCVMEVEPCPPPGDLCRPTPVCKRKVGCALNICSLSCRDGYEKDHQGCELCRCLPPQPRETCATKYCDLNRHCAMRRRQCPRVPAGQDGSYWCLPEPTCLPNNNRCNAVLCPFTCDTGYMKDHRGCDICICIPKPSRPDCTNKICPPNQECKMEQFCPTCPAEAKCLPRCPDVTSCPLVCEWGLAWAGDCLVCRCRTVKTTCQFHYCDLNLHCEMRQMECLPPPPGTDRNTWCLPEPVCVYNNEVCKGVRCSLKCDKGFLKDDQDCDICECVITDHGPTPDCTNTVCPDDQVCKVERPCATCPAEAKCKPQGSLCPDFTCNLACQKGLEKMKGCSICKCKQTLCEPNYCNLNLHCEMHQNAAPCPTPPTGRDASQWCLPEPTCIYNNLVCQSVACSLRCDKGYVKDGKDCDTCLCVAQDPRPNCTDTICPGNQVCRLLWLCETCPVEAKCTNSSDACKAVTCSLKCMDGFMKDDQGCSICECVTEQPRLNCSDKVCPTGQVCRVEQPCETCPAEAKCISNNAGCSAVKCDLTCDEGFVKDQQGCDSCECVGVPSMANCSTVKCKLNERCEMMSGPCADGSPAGDNTTESTCHLPVCTKNKGCDVLTCSMECDKGYIKDNQGCDVCQCASDSQGSNCMNLQCSSDEICKVTKSCPTCAEEAQCINETCDEIDCDLKCELAEDSRGCNICKCKPAISQCDPPCLAEEICSVRTPACTKDSCPPSFYRCEPSQDDAESPCDAVVCPDCTAPRFLWKNIDANACLKDCQCLDFFEFCEMENCPTRKCLLSSYDCRQPSCHEHKVDCQANE